VRAGATGALDSRGLLISSSRAGSTANPRILQMQSRWGHLAATPQRPYGSGVRSLTLEGFEQAPQINRVRDDEGVRIRAYARAHQLEGAHRLCSRANEGS
jgi:hypothetical protein